MDDMTPSSDDSGDITNDADNWQGRYAGLQKVLSKRDTELTTATTSLDQLRKEHEQALADLNTYRQRDVDASEEEQAKAQYESLRARFEAPPPTPIGNNPKGTSWTDGREDDANWRDRDRIDRGAGWV